MANEDKVRHLDEVEREARRGEVPTPTEWLDSIIQQANDLKQHKNLEGMPDDCKTTLENLDADISALLSWADDNWEEED